MKVRAPVRARTSTRAGKRGLLQREPAAISSAAAPWTRSLPEKHWQRKCWPFTCVDFRRVIVYNGEGLSIRVIWGRSSVGRAPEWHSGGRGFDSHRLHQEDRSNHGVLPRGFSMYSTTEPCTFSPGAIAMGNRGCRGQRVVQGLDIETAY